MNYFEIFGLDMSFDLDLASLSSIYQSLQKTAHPDRFAHASQQEQLVALKKSTLINDAYQTLKLPLKRAEYILTLRDVELPNEQQSFSDNMFLMRQMELREMIGDVKGASDIDAALFKAHETLDQEYAQIFVTLQQALAKNTTESNLLASESLRKLKFYQKLHIELDKLEDQIFDH